MKLLLDTHAFLWLVDGSPNLSTTAQTAFCDPANALFLSVASVWELSIKTVAPIRNSGSATHWIYTSPNGRQLIKFKRCPST